MSRILLHRSTPKHTMHNTAPVNIFQFFLDPQYPFLNPKGPCWSGAVALPLSPPDSGHDRQKSTSHIMCIAIILLRINTPNMFSGFEKKGRIFPMQPRRSRYRAEHARKTFQPCWSVLLISPRASVEHQANTTPNVARLAEVHLVFGHRVLR